MTDVSEVCGTSWSWIVTFLADEHGRADLVL